MIDIKQRLKQLNVEPDSEIGLKLIKLDEAYQKVEDLEKGMYQLFLQREQAKEDIEVMELFIMHQMNKMNRFSK